MPVMELLKSEKQCIDKILVGSGEHKGSILEIISMAKEKKILIKYVSKQRLDQISFKENHQNVIAITTIYEYGKIEDIFCLAQKRHQKPFIVILDGIEDPHNMGAIIRTVEVAGGHGVIIPKRRSVGVTPTVMKISAGAAKNLPIVRVSNLTNVIKELQNKGVWIYCLEACGEPWIKFDYRESIAVIIGSEGKGVSRLVKETCDFVVSLPVKGKINSLNASVAAGVFMFEVLRQRL